MAVGGRCDDRELLDELATLRLRLVVDAGPRDGRRRDVGREGLAETHVGDQRIHARDPALAVLELGDQLLGTRASSWVTDLLGKGAVDPLGNRAPLFVEGGLGRFQETGAVALADGRVGRFFDGAENRGHGGVICALDVGSWILRRDTSRRGGRRVNRSRSRGDHGTRNPRLRRRRARENFAGLFEELSRAGQAELAAPRVERRVVVSRFELFVPVPVVRERHEPRRDGVELNVPRMTHHVAPHVDELELDACCIRIAEPGLAALRPFAEHCELADDLELLDQSGSRPFPWRDALRERTHVVAGGAVSEIQGALHGVVEHVVIAERLTEHLLERRDHDLRGRRGAMGVSCADDGVNNHALWHRRR